MATSTSTSNPTRSSTQQTQPESSTSIDKKPTVIITIGMAGAGKSTFVQRINSYLHTPTASNPHPRPPYILNLDPAVTNVPFEANIDIRDTVEYKEVMKQCVSFFCLPHDLAILNSTNSLLDFYACS